MTTCIIYLNYAHTHMHTHTHTYTCTHTALQSYTVLVSLLHSGSRSLRFCQQRRLLNVEMLSTLLYNLTHIMRTHINMHKQKLVHMFTHTQIAYEHAQILITLLKNQLEINHKMTPMYGRFFGHDTNTKTHHTHTN